MSDRIRTAIVADNHIKIFIEIKFKECMTHEILDANSKNGTSIFYVTRIDIDDDALMIDNQEKYLRREFS